MAAEQITPYQPGILNDAVIEPLRSGLDAGMNVPDATAGNRTQLTVKVQTRPAKMVHRENIRDSRGLDDCRTPDRRMRRIERF
jgi:hypothetical protein